MAEDKITAAETANEGAKKSENIVELGRGGGLGAVRDHDGICPRHGGQGHRNAH